jgi:hypothetical protein
VRGAFEHALVELADAAAAAIGRERLAAEVGLVQAGADDGVGVGLGEHRGGQRRDVGQGRGGRGEGEAERAGDVVEAGDRDGGEDHVLGERLGLHLAGEDHGAAEGGDAFEAFVGPVVRGRGGVVVEKRVVVTLVDRLVHRAEVIEVAAQRFRLGEARDSSAARSKRRKTKPA